MEKKYISIIFDDGPREPMSEMIEKFISYDYKCGFAIIGQQINDDTLEVLKYAIDNGFELCSHTQTHQNVAKLDNIDLIIDEFQKPIDTVFEKLGYRIKTARVPYLQMNEMISKVSNIMNLPFLGQGIHGAPDWEPDITAQRISDSIIDNIYDGAILTFHVTKATCDSLDICLPVLKEMGFELLNPSDILTQKCGKTIPLGININKV